MTTIDPLALIARVIESQRGRTSRRRVGCFVALGDSFTAGTGCAPGESWADRIAAGLERREDAFAYRNLAVDGATSAEVRKQVGPALRLEPDLVSVICGANDLLFGPRLDVLEYSRNLSGIFTSLRQTLPTARIVTATAPERWEFLPVGPRTRRRLEDGLERRNRVTRDLAASHGVALLDVATHPGLGRAENFAADGLHPSSLGHARTAHGIAYLLEASFGLELDGEVLR